MSDLPVKPGQIWADNDLRSKGRTLEVISVYQSRIADSVAVCKILTNEEETQRLIDNPQGSYAPKDRRGKTTTIKVRRFKPTSTGYRLIQDVS